MTTAIINQELCEKVLSVVDKGLVRGIGVPKPGKMCVEAAVNYALGLNHSDEPKCVGPTVRIFKIRLNDSWWSSDIARTNGLRKLSIAQLGSDQIDQRKFNEIISLETVRQVLPIILKKIDEPQFRCCECEEWRGRGRGSRQQNPRFGCPFRLAPGKTNDLKTCAENCRNATDLESATAAYTAAITATISSDYSDISIAAYIAHIIYFASQAEVDSILQLYADIALKALIKLKSPGTEYLYLCNE